jgi:chorismate mutase/prephenate dehydratase
MRIAYLGPPGTYTQIAATRAFGNSAEYLEAATIRGVFEAVERGQAQFGVVPLENSGEGGVRQTLQAFQDSELRIRSEAVHRIEHCLVSNAAELGAIERVYSHPQALSQCRRWIHENLPRAALLESDSTAAAARLASQDMSSAAVASKLSAELLGLGLLREGIQDQQGNATRFVVVGAEDAPRTGHDRTSFLCVLRHAPGALKAVVDAFVTRGLEISRFESHPHPQEKWRHHYFVDFLGHRSEPQVAEALGEAAEQCLEFKVLGSYPFGLGDGA